VRNIGTVTLKDTQNKTQTQLFIEIYRKLQTQGALDDEKIFETALEMLPDKMNELKVEREQNWTKEPPNLLSNFKDAVSKTTPAPSINIKDIFKD
jgi:small subunit ribosomal protein S23